MAVERVSVDPRMIRWAVERSGRSDQDLSRFPIETWLSEANRPTMRQLEEFAKATYIPVGFLFLPEPPEETVPIPDFRTFRDQGVRRATPNLLDTIYACEERQDWFREFAEVNDGEPVELVGSLTLDTPPIEAAHRLRDALGFGLDRRVEFPNWSEALRGLIEHAEDVGVLVMTNGVVAATHTGHLIPRSSEGLPWRMSWRRSCSSTALTIRQRRSSRWRTNWRT